MLLATFASWRFQSYMHVLTFHKVYRDGRPSDKRRRSAHEPQNGNYSSCNVKVYPLKSAGTYTTEDNDYEILRSRERFDMSISEFANELLSDIVDIGGATPGSESERWRPLPVLVIRFKSSPIKGTCWSSNLSRSKRPWFGTVGRFKL